LSVLSKGFERLINGQVLAHVDHSGLLSEFQSEFRYGHSTTTALVRMIEDLRSMDRQGMVSTFLNGRSMVVDVDGARSSPRAFFPVCPRVLYLHHVFFYVCQLSVRTYSSFEISFYVDDLQIYLSGNRFDLNGLIARVNEDLENIHRWSIQNRLLLNPAKSQAILVSNSLLFLGDIAL
jgi:hypothetical protein